VPSYVWLIPLLPLAGLIVNFLLMVFGGMRQSRVSGYVAILAMGAAFVLSVLALFWAMGQPRSTDMPIPVVGSFNWYTAGGVAFPLGAIFDPLAVVMLVVVTFVSTLVQIYSQGYMDGDPGYARYYAFMCLFTMSMLGLVIAPNFLQMYIFWELVGVSSYLLIGFWWGRPSAAAAAKKAFITTRVGDLGFLIGILILFTQTHTFDFAKIADAVKTGSLGGTTLVIAMILVFAGAVGKSAQFPLHAWLPDAMEGPTPVSALIHAATMVAAGVYMVARTMPIFQGSPEAMLVVAWIGGFTALFAATQGLVMSDIKRVLAYSTISQLGYMMLGLGLGSLTAGTFHLVTHAFFKALLFLAAGAVIHGTGGEQNMFYMGGLFKKMPVTALTFLAGSLALAAIPPFAGFWSKDEIVGTAYQSGNVVLFLFAIITAGLTAFYIFRAWLMTFLGERRLNPELVAAAAHGGHSNGHDGHGLDAHGHLTDGHDTGHGHSGHAPGDAHESPLVMTGPLIVLAILAVVAGFIGSPLFHGAFQGFVAGSQEADVAIDVPLAALSTGIGLLGILIAWAFYGAHWLSAEAFTAKLRPIYLLFLNRYYVDDIYGWLVGTVLLGLSHGFAWFDRAIVDGIVNGVAWLSYAIFGRVLTWAETGRMPNYALGFFVGVIIIAGIVVGIPVGH
jgi:NADH-quinone oxidoreductase subunit L